MMRNREYKGLVLCAVILTAVCALVCLRLHPAAALVCMVLGVSLTAVFSYCTWKRYTELARLNEYLLRILSGNYDMELHENKEGELSLLKNNLYKVTVLLRSQNERLKADKTALGDALADISHQLKTPLTSLVMMTDLLKEEKNSQKQKEFLDISQNQLEKMQWLILNLLKLSRLDAGTITMQKEPVSIKEVLKESVGPFLLTMDLRGIVWEDTGRDFVFQGDKSWTAEALGNIIKNCVEHMEQGGRLRVETKSTTLYDELVISDTGSGIASEDLPHIFERFYHGKNASSDSVGIGLALARAVLERERAEIQVSSEEGAGTTFVVKFYKAVI